MTPSRRKKHVGSPINRISARQAAKGGGAIKGAAKPGGKAKAKARAKAGKECFVNGCIDSVKGTSLWCQKHWNFEACMRYQAKKKGARGLQLLNELLSNRDSASREMDTWEENNPEGQGRKALIDFSQWEQKYGQRTSTTFRDEDDLMDWADFAAWKKLRGEDVEDIKKEWDRLVKDPKVEGEGSGSGRMIWIAKTKKRMRDRSFYEEFIIGFSFFDSQINRPLIFCATVIVAIAINFLHHIITKNKNTGQGSQPEFQGEGYGPGGGRETQEVRAQLRWQPQFGVLSNCSPQKDT